MKSKIKIDDLSKNDEIRSLTEQELAIVSGGQNIPVLGIGIVVEGVFTAVYKAGQAFGSWLRRNVF